MSLSDPFAVEKKRQILAEKTDFENLQKLYHKNIPEIRDLNSAPFWDQRLDQKHTLSMEDGMTQTRVKTAASYLPISAKKIFDIGVGYGFIEEILLKQNIERSFYGNDISPIAIDSIKNRFPGSYRVESLYDMRYSPHSFDAIFLLEVLEHIPPSKTFILLRQIKTMLKKGGYFIISVPMNEGLEHMSDNPNGHVRMYTKPLIIAELKIAGFEVITSTEIYAFSSLYWLKSHIAKIWKKWEPNNIILLAQSL